MSRASEPATQDTSVERASTPQASESPDSNDVPVDGDFDGDGRSDPATYRPATGEWRVWPSSRNYVYFHGGVVRFGKLTMTDADLQLTDADPSDPFDFFPERYLKQLVAGYSRTTERGGLKVVMPDIGDIGSARGRVRTPPVPRGNR